jgi:hypothetical protein
MIAYNIQNCGTSGLSHASGILNSRNSTIPKIDVSIPLHDDGNRMEMG